PEEYALFHNPHGIVDGNSYSFLTNQMGVAVNGFPNRSASDGARLTIFKNVHVYDQQAFINEVVALNTGAGPATDPIGAVWQTQNRHPDTAAPLTVDALGDNARYRGNVVANAQALVAKAIHAGAFATSHLDISRSSITPAMVRWAEGQGTIGSVTGNAPGATAYLCNGDSMFHVNKGTIGFKIDAASVALLYDTSVDGLSNTGDTGSTDCGDYSQTLSHPAATLPGYGGSNARGYSVAGSRAVLIQRGKASNVVAANGDATGFDLLTDSKRIKLKNVTVNRVSAGLTGAGTYTGPNRLPVASGVHVSEAVTRSSIRNLCTHNLRGYGGSAAVIDDSGAVHTGGRCR
ncbi:MAG: hypothetical protein AB8B93_13235, partial [Pseudomonadales bacterium]